MSASSYGRADRLLHRLALGSRAVAEMSFDMEKATQHPDGDAVATGAHVFIAGLARAGTTILMRRFHASGLFGTLTYRDMPFVLAPGLWAKLSRRNRRSIARAERAHGDGLLVDIDSPESLDEVFWRIFCGPDYLRPDALVPHDPDKETIAAYRAHVAAILKSREGRPGRYLSKTNNSILRLGALRRAFPAALIIVPFREPVSQAASLLAQHRHFREDQRADRFILDYMGWLGHHEFGLGHRPFVFGGERPAGDPDTLGYWLSLWCGVYEALLARHRGEVRFVSYDRLCTEPAVWDALAAAAGLPEGAAAEPLRHAVREAGETVPAEIAERAAALHAELLAAAGSGEDRLSGR